MDQAREMAGCCWKGFLVGNITNNVTPLKAFLKSEDVILEGKGFLVGKNTKWANLHFGIFIPYTSSYAYFARSALPSMMYRLVFQMLPPQPNIDESFFKSSPLQYLA